MLLFLLAAAGAFPASVLGGVCVCVVGEGGEAVKGHQVDLLEKFDVPFLSRGGRSQWPVWGNLRWLQLVQISSSTAAKEATKTALLDFSQ